MGAVKVLIGKLSGNNGPLDFYPVGSIYQSFDPTSPEVLFGGEWEQITGKFLRAANDTSTGGSDTVTLTEAQIPSHRHGFGTNQRLVTWGGLASGDGAFTNPDNTFGTWYRVSPGDDRYTYNKISGNTNLSAYTTNTGSTQSHSNMPAYQDVYTWKRIA